MRVLEEVDKIVRDKWPKGKGGRVFVVFACILGFIALCIWALAKFVKAISAGGFRNQDLYIPRMGYNRRRRY